MTSASDPRSHRRGVPLTGPPYRFLKRGIYALCVCSLVSCSFLFGPSDEEEEEGEGVEIGTEGGMIESQGETGATLWIPPGALVETVEIVLDTAESTVAGSPLGPGIRLSLPGASVDSWASGETLRLIVPVTSQPDPTRNPVLKVLFYDLTEPWYIDMPTPNELGEYVVEVPSEDMRALIQLAGDAKVSVRIFADQDAARGAVAPTAQRVTVDPEAFPPAECNDSPAERLDYITRTSSPQRVAVVFVHGWGWAVGNCWGWEAQQEVYFDPAERSFVSTTPYRWGIGYWETMLDALSDLSDEYPVWVYKLPVAHLL